jgi:hypothetical protein
VRLLLGPLGLIEERPDLIIFNGALIALREVILLADPHQLLPVLLIALPQVHHIPGELAYPCLLLTDPLLLIFEHPLHLGGLHVLQPHPLHLLLHLPYHPLRLFQLPPALLQRLLELCGG